MPTAWVVRAWFGEDSVIFSLATSDPRRAEAYAEHMKKQYWGLRITTEEEADAPNLEPLPDNSALLGSDGQVITELVDWLAEAFTDEERAEFEQWLIEEDIR